MVYDSLTLNDELKLLLKLVLMINDQLKLLFGLTVPNYGSNEKNWDILKN